MVEGLQKVQPAVAGLAQRIFVIRDQNVAGLPPPGGPNDVPSWDVTLNYVPIPYPSYTPAIVKIKPGEKQLWRVVNACGDTNWIFNSNTMGNRRRWRWSASMAFRPGLRTARARARCVKMTDIFIPNAARAEFIVTGPSKSVKNATFLTLNVDTGPDGDIDPKRPLATLTNPESRDQTAQLEMPCGFGRAGTAALRGTGGREADDPAHAVFFRREF